MNAACAGCTDWLLIGTIGAACIGIGFISGFLATTKLVTRTMHQMLKETNLLSRPIDRLIQGRRQ